MTSITRNYARESESIMKKLTSIRELTQQSREHSFRSSVNAQKHRIACQADMIDNCLADICTIQQIVDLCEVSETRVKSHVRHMIKRNALVMLSDSSITLECALEEHEARNKTRSAYRAKHKLTAKQSKALTKRIQNEVKKVFDNIAQNKKAQNKKAQSKEQKSA